MIKRRFSRSRDIVSQIDGYIEKNIPSRWKNVGGDMITGWLLWNEHWYYLKPDGIMAADEMTPDGYKIEPDGTLDSVKMK
jgi:hypothetical protein